jgi:hypothetical protein
MVAVMAMLSAGCHPILPSGGREPSDSPEAFTRILLQQSDEVVSFKKHNYDSSVTSKMDAGLRDSISNLEKQMLTARNKAQESNVFLPFDIATIPNDLILLRREIPDHQKILRVDSHPPEISVVVQETLDGDERSEGYVGEIVVLFHQTSHSLRLKDVVFRRYKGIPDWRLSDYLSERVTMLDDYIRRL